MYSKDKKIIITFFDKYILIGEMQNTNILFTSNIYLDLHMWFMMHLGYFSSGQGHLKIGEKQFCHFLFVFVFSPKLYFFSK